MSADREATGREPSQRHRWIVGCPIKYAGTFCDPPAPSTAVSVSPGNFLFDFYKPAISAGRSCTLVIDGQCGQSI
jgi:hypothetical protein